MNIRLDFGTSGLPVAVPDKNLIAVAEMSEEGALADPRGQLSGLLLQPDGTAPFPDLCKGRSRACIVVSDKTRPVPNAVILPPLLDILEQHRVRTTILVACGMHAPTEGKDLEALLGKEILDRCKIVNHRGEDAAQVVNIGKSSEGIDVFINRHYVAADLRVCTGFIEPHFMAGFSGGRKAVCPGIAGAQTMRHAHSPGLMEAPLSSAGVIAGNPFHAFALEAARMAGVDFIVNVTLNRGKRITGIFAGDLERAHAAGVDFCRKQAAVRLPRAADIVVTSNGGYPLDQDFYQTVKGMVCALPAVKPGGTIIIAAECSRGIGSENFRRLLFGMTSDDEFTAMINRPGFFCIDQWEVEQLIKAKRAAKIKLFTAGIPQGDVRRCGVEPIGSVEQGIAESLRQYGPNATLTVIPAGPYVLPEIPN